MLDAGNIKQARSKNGSVLISQIVDYIKTERSGQLKYKKKPNVTILNRFRFTAKQFPTSTTMISDLNKTNTTPMYPDFATNNSSAQETYRFSPIDCRCDKYCDLYNVNGNLWKSTFFVMALLILFVTMCLIVLLAVKTLM
jgi:hypothetical protein